MNNSGDVAEQVLRMSLDGVEFTLKIVGAGAKNLAVLLYTILSQQKRTKGRARMETIMRSAVRSGIPAKIYSIKESDLREFSGQAKRYGVLYCAVRDPKGSPDKMVDVVVRGEDAAKIERITERFKFAAVETATVKAEIEKSRADKTPEAPDKNDTEKLLDDLLGTPEGKAEPEKPEAAKAEPDKAAAKKEAPANPTAARTEKSPPSEPTSKPPEKSAKGTSDKPSVREELREIKAARREKDADAPKREEPGREDKPKSSKGAQHKQPQTKPKTPKKPKVR